jgi:hypothetical protein
MSERQMTTAELVKWAEDQQKDYAKKRAAASLQTALVEAARKRREMDAALTRKDSE